MLSVKRCLMVGLVLLVALCFTEARAQILPPNVGYPALNSGSGAINNYYMSLGLRRYINSFTSYEFVIPEWPEIDPASRLEWPWEQTYGVIKAGFMYRGLQVNLEGASTLLTYSGLMAQDSDWEDPGQPNQMTTFSEAEAHPRGWTIDASVGFDLPVLANVRWILGYRAQQFRFTYTDMYQKELYHPERNGMDEGEAIQFTQDYRHYYGGTVTGAQLDMGNVSSYMMGTILAVRLLGDVGYVTANNLDYHVLRLPGPRHTYEITNGISWRLNLATDLKVNNRFTVGLAGEFMRIRTQGSHRMTNPAGLDGDGNYVPNTDESWQGARVWSEQKFIEFNASLNF